MEETFAFTVLLWTAVVVGLLPAPKLPEALTVGKMVDEFAPCGAFTAA